jgi:hypothetical protein
MPGRPGGTRQVYAPPPHPSSGVQTHFTITMSMLGVEI